MIGVVLAVLISGTAFSVVSAIGVLMLIGIIVNNAIVLIDFINQEKAENPEQPRTQRVVNAGLVRMRPILMTSLTSILGFLPMAVTSTSGGAMMQPLAVRNKARCQKAAPRREKGNEKGTGLGVAENARNA